VIEVEIFFIERLGGAGGKGNFFFNRLATGNKPPTEVNLPAVN